MNKLAKIMKGFVVKRRWHSNCRDSHIWLFGEWFGKRCCDNCMYFANYIACSHPEIKIYWTCLPEADTSSLSQNITCIFFGTAEAEDICKKAGIVVMSQGFGDFSFEGWNYFDGALTIQLWHGIPWKKIGHDGSKRNDVLYKAYIKLYDNVFGAKMYVSPSDKYDSIAQTAFGAKQNAIIHAGYARNSVFYDSDAVERNRLAIIKKLQELNASMDFSQCRIITYMPTFRNTAEASYSIAALGKKKRFADFLLKENVIVIQKSHFVNQRRDGMNGQYSDGRFYVLNDAAAQELLCATDLLVTDYSGAFFDFLLLDRPIVHYLYDYDYYRTQDRGLYYNKDEVVGGEAAVDEDQLIDAIIRNIGNTSLFSERRRNIRAEYLKYDTDKSCEILYQRILEEQKKVIDK